MVLSIAIRFIPVVAEEFTSIKQAQWSRGAAFDEGGFISRIKAYCMVLLPMMVGLFRKAENLSVAMDARCYGLPGVRRTDMFASRFQISDALITLVLSTIFIVLAVVA